VYLKWNEIEKISYQSRNSSNWQGIGMSSMIIGGIASLLVAPLISFNYKNGNFSTKTFFTCAGIGFGFIIIGIPITVCNEGEEYYLAKPENMNVKTIWRYN